MTRTLLGSGDSHLRRLREALGVDVIARNDSLHLNGTDESVDRGLRAVMGMLRIIRKSQQLHPHDVERILESVRSSGPDDSGIARNRSGSQGSRGSDEFAPKGEALAGRVSPQTSGQERYLAAMRAHDIVFAIGPAGSGKTYMAVAAAIEALANNRVKRLILVRPAVEAGEKLGFLPGDLAEKVNPYLRPLYDALHDMLSPSQIARYTERGVIEIAPLAFMRGRTLNSAFVILDEAQNSTPKQMKMFLTRLGRDAKAVITGDITQVDLPDGDLSGLAHAQKVLREVDGVSFVRLEKQDIVRHPLVQRIVNAYESSEGEEE
jgi:phosphate starvation-inducible protein PhoH and related proteins